MRVLFVVHGFPPHAQGGAEIFAELQALTLCERHGDTVLVLTREADPGRPEYDVRTEHRDGLTIAWVNNTFRQTRSFAETYDNPSVTRVATDLIEGFGPDVAHVHHLTCLSTGIVGALAQRGIPCLVTLHDYWLICHRGQLLDRDLRVCGGPEPAGCARCVDGAAGVGRTGFAVAAALRSLEHRTGIPTRGLRRAAARVASVWRRGDETADESRRRLEHMRGVVSEVTHFLAPSESIRRRFIAFGIEPGRITHAPYGFDRRRFQRATRSDAAHLRLGFLGSLMVSKAPHLLLEAFRQLPEGTASLDVFGRGVSYHGDDSYQARLDPLLKQSGVRVMGPVSHADVADALASVDVLVVPSVWPENSPLVIQEAFLAGAPVVASRIGGIPEVVRDGINGLLFEPGCVEDLHRVLHRLVTERGLLSELRHGIAQVRTIEDDVAFTRGLYERSRREVAPSEEPGRDVHRVAAVVLNYATPDDTVLSVRSLLTSRRPLTELIVVDNDPSHVCRDALSPLHDRVHYRHTVENVGFSAGVNVGIRDALERGATHVLLVNSDVIVPPDCLAALERALLTTPNAGIAGPVVVSRSEPDRVLSRGMSYSSTTGRMRHLDYGARHTSETRGGVVDAVAGALMLIRRDVFEQIGFFAEEYFFSFEDLEFCLRAKRMGFLTVVADGATVYHEGSQSIGSASSDRLYYAARNHLLAAAQSDGTTGRVHAWGRATTIVALNVAHAVRFGGGSLTTRVGAVGQGTYDFFRGRFGPR